MHQSCCGLRTAEESEEEEREEDEAAEAAEKEEDDQRDSDEQDVQQEAQEADEGNDDEDQDGDQQDDDDQEDQDAEAKGEDAQIVAAEGVGGPNGRFRSTSEQAEQWTGLLPPEANGTWQVSEQACSTCSGSKEV